MTDIQIRGVQSTVNDTDYGLGRTLRERADRSQVCMESLYRRPLPDMLIAFASEQGRTPALRTARERSVAHRRDCP
jgi:hypothetical protein